eukprot:144732_1
MGGTVYGFNTKRSRQIFLCICLFLTSIFGILFIIQYLDMRIYNSLPSENKFKETIKEKNERGTIKEIKQTFPFQFHSGSTAGQQKTIINQHLKIFSIGFGCSGTGSFVNYFKGIIGEDKMVNYEFHHKWIGRDILYPNYVEIQKNKKISLFEGLPSPDDLLFIGDLKLGTQLTLGIGVEIVKRMNTEYPNSINLIMLRPLSQYMKSKIYGFRKKESKKENGYSEVAIDEITKYFTYNCAVLQYFTETSQMNKLILYDIEKGNFHDFKTEFYQKTGIKLAGELPKKNGNHQPNRELPKKNGNHQPNRELPKKNG